MRREVALKRFARPAFTDTPDVPSPALRMRLGRHRGGGAVGRLTLRASQRTRRVREPARPAVRQLLGERAANTGWPSLSSGGCSRAGTRWQAQSFTALGAAM